MRLAPLLLLLFGAPALAAGSLRGTVRYAGTSRPAPAREVTRQIETCGASQDDLSLLVGPGGALQNAVVSLSGVKSARPPPTEGARLDQRRCNFQPRVQAVTVGSRVKLNNGDPILHSVNAQLSGKVVFNLAMPQQDLAFSTRPLATPGLVKVHCEAGHDWMAAYLHVFAHPYFAVTGEDGTFELRDVPPGSYTLEIWHERQKAPERRAVQIAEGAPSSVEVVLH